jgi:RimJ/RimL family protein N-acetyltransferase
MTDQLAARPTAPYLQGTPNPGSWISGPRQLDLDPATICPMTTMKRRRDSRPPPGVPSPPPPSAAPEIELVPWSEDDLWLLERTMGEPDMTTYLGGPETPEKLAERHRRYLRVNADGSGRILKIVTADGTVVGTVLYWESSSDGDAFYEIGWAVLPTFQGRGYATQATLAAAELARADGKYRTLHAFPNVQNAASNAVCAKAGFTNLGTVDVEFPKGNPMTCNDWCLELHPRVDTDAVAAAR